MALVLTRLENEGIFVDGPAIITIGRIGSRVQVIVTADPQVNVKRLELIGDKAEQVTHLEAATKRWRFLDRDDSIQERDNGTHIAPAARTHSLDD